MRQLSQYSRGLGMSIGLKNALDVVRYVQNDIQFAVNEECGGETDACQKYESFINPRRGRGNPVFHIEYVSRVPVYEGASSPSPAASRSSAIPITQASSAAPQSRGS